LLGLSDLVFTSIDDTRPTLYYSKPSVYLFVRPLQIQRQQFLLTARAAFYLERMVIRMALANLQGHLTEMKREGGHSPATMEENSEKANPSKGGDAKPWVYLLHSRTRQPSRRR
jgi:hypothetical protein